MTTQFITTKKHLTQTWDKTGKRHPVTILYAPSLTVSQIKTNDRDGYPAIQVAIGSQKPHRINKPTFGKLKKSGLKTTPKLFKEITFCPREDQSDSLKPGDEIKIDQVLSPGDLVQASSRSKGHGFTGVVARWGFAGGPRTHGQSDRERAPGSIGQGTTPGRVYKGKKMAGRHGHFQVTVKNLLVIKTDPKNEEIWVKGTIPGRKGSLVLLTKTDHKQTFPGLHTDPDPETETSKDDPQPSNTNRSSDDKQATNKENQS